MPRKPKVGGWFIERPNQPLFHARKDGAVLWVQKTEDAMRFSSKDEARQYLIAYRHFFTNGGRLVERTT